MSAAPATEPIAVLTSRPPWRETFASLKVPNYRLYVAGQIVGTTAQGMQRIAQDWIVLILSGNVADVGITVAMQFAPMLLFGLWGGVIADRYSKRAILMLTQTVGAVLAASLAVLILSGVAEVWMIWGIALIGGLNTVIDGPARQAFVAEIVGPRHLRNAISLNSSTFQLGALIGPAVGGLLIDAVGGGWAFAINAVGCMVAFTMLAFMNSSKLLPAPRQDRGRKGQLVEGMLYAGRKPAIRYTLIMVAAVSMFAYTLPVLLTDFADNVFRVGASGYGLFNALVALGALSGALLSTRRLNVGLRTTVGGAAALGGIQLIAGLVPSIAPFAVLLTATGVASLLFLTAANSLTQMSTNLGIRGRVMGVYVLIQLGCQAIGGPIMGGLVDRFGPHVGMVVSGGVPLVTAVVVGWLILRERGEGLRGTAASLGGRRRRSAPRNLDA